MTAAIRLPLRRSRDHEGLIAWNLASPNWQELIRTGQSLVPKLPLDDKAASRAVRVFDKLRLPDVPGKPLLKDAAGDWFRGETSEDEINSKFDGLV